MCDGSLVTCSNVVCNSDLGLLAIVGRVCTMGVLHGVNKHSMRCGLAYLVYQQNIRLHEYEEVDSIQSERKVT